MCTAVRDGAGGTTSWFSMSSWRSGSDADVDGVEGRGTQSWPKKLVLWEGMQPEVPAIVKVVCWTISLEVRRWILVSRPRLIERVEEGVERGEGRQGN